MKKLAISAKLFISAFIFAGLTLTACGSGDSKDKNDSTKAAATPKTEKVSDPGFASSANFRYIDDSTLMNNYEFAKVTMEQCQKIAHDLETYQNSIGRQIQNREAEIAKKAQSNGYLTEASYKADLQEYQRFRQNLEAQFAKRAQADNEKIARLSKDLKDAIDNFIVRYNKEKKYDAIFHRWVDGANGPTQIDFYFNPQLDITDEVVRLLNEEYKASKK